MKRFDKKAAAREAEGGHDIALDDRPVRTPAKNALVVPTPALAQAIADEWNAQGEKVEPRSMPLTGLANAAIDRVGPDHEGFVRGLTVYGETDLLCYRADGPDGLVARQAAHWDPLLAWARARYEADFAVALGIVHKAQPDETVERLRAAVEARDGFALAALSPLVTISGSLIIALALAEGAVDLEGAWSAATVDETWQAEHWGEDTEEAKRLAARRIDFDAAYRFLTLLS
jgi:chaperone required for assembly of F1-ATPase